MSTNINNIITTTFITTIPELWEEGKKGVKDL